MTDQYIAIDLSGLPCLVYNEVYGIDRWLSYTNPRGQRPGMAQCLMLERDVRQINPLQSLELNMAAGDSISISRLWFDKAESVSGGVPPDDNRAMLVTLWDSRKILGELTSINKQYNVRCPAPPTISIDGTDANEFYADSLNGEEPWTWGQIAADIWSRLPASLVGPFPDMPIQPYGVPQNFRYQGVNAWWALHDFLGHLRCTTAYDPQNDRFSIVNLALEQPGLVEAYQGYRSRLLEDAGPYAGNSLWFPEKIRVFFRKQSKHYGTEPDTPRHNNWADDGAMTWGDVPTGVAGAIPGTIHDIFADLPAIIDYDGTVLNSEAGQSHATLLAEQWIADRLSSVPRANKIYQGIASAFDTPGSQTSSVCFYGFREQGMMTQVSLSPAEPYLLGEVAMAAPAAKSENLQPTNLGRPTTPSYPRAVQLVQIASQEQDDSGRYRAYVVQTDPGGNYKSGAPPTTDLEPCFVVESSPNIKRRRETCAVYMARLNGSAEDDEGVTLPLYVLDSEGGQVLLGKAQADINYKATGAVYVWDGPPGAEVQLNPVVSVQLYNSGPKLSKDDLVYFTNDCQGARRIPVNPQPILGKTTADIAIDKSGLIDVYSVPQGSQQGQEQKVDPPKQITAFNKHFGFIPKDTWVLCENDGDGWYISTTKRGDIFLAQVPPNSSRSQANAFMPPQQIDVQLQINDQAVTYSGNEPTVKAFLRFSPVIESEQVVVVWTGTIFTIAHGEFDGGILGLTFQDVPKGGTTTGAHIALTGQNPGVTMNATVNSPLGQINNGKLMWISRNKNGFTGTSAEC